MICLHLSEALQHVKLDYFKMSSNSLNDLTFGFTQTV